MKKNTFNRNFIFCCLFTLAVSTLLNAQTSSNINLLYQDKIDTLPINYRDSYYSECWGFTSFNNDYAVISSTLGTHIYDITDAENSYQAAFIPSPVNGYSANWRDFHDHDGFLYIVNDGPKGVLQIVDLRRLPNMAEIVYESDELFTNAHNIFIDTATAKLYVCGGNTLDNQAINLGIYSLERPQKPELLNTYADFGYIHDCFVRNDTAYLESPDEKALYVVDFSDINNPETLGSLTNYPTAGSGYTHAGWLSDNGQYYVLSDESYSATIKLLNVEELDDIKVVSQFSSGVSDSSMVHNPIIVNNLVFVSYYNDGLQVFDISDPTDVTKVGFYDTYPNAQKGDYRGAWGVYPFKNGKVVVSDRQTGLYVFDASNLMGDFVSSPSLEEPLIRVYPNPVKNSLVISNDQIDFDSYKIYSVDGKLLIQNNAELSKTNTVINIGNLNSGLYYLVLSNNNHIISSKKVLKE